ncbi:MAG TPA: NlpC/P60 family protein [Flavobacteriales bacterium]|nr:NlpC/P60 family protein [Flavobacteriales bacterium]HRE74029.1 C40 family peptidase [Flavobacteriales bacterium]HRJ35826.1 C40 family peptidase [Flavobacteriales bacterium]HRJ38293.1 C40 family peptidase [Flavobacteriales bacterium]
MVKSIIIAAAFQFSGNAIEVSTSVSSREILADSVVVYAKEFLGTPYVWAGCSPKGFDCSGFVHYVFSKFGFSIGRSSSGLANAGSALAFEEADRGDLILFRGTNPADKSVGHVGIVISPQGDSLQFIHASSSKKHFGVVITDYYRSGYPARFVAMRRMLQ